MKKNQSMTRDFKEFIWNYSFSRSEYYFYTLHEEFDYPFSK